MARKSVSVLIALSFAWFVAACTPFVRPPSPPQSAAYLLEGPSRPDTHAHSPAAPGPVVTVPRTRSAPGFDTDRMAYVTEPYLLSYFAYHRWAEKPADMFHQAFTRSLWDSGIFLAVLDESSPARATLLIETHSFSLIQVFENGMSRIDIDLGARIVDIATRDVIAERAFHVSEPVSNPDPVSGVRAANIALLRIMEEMTSWIAGAIGP